ncbi:MAG: ferritin [Armatimonadetes bacterium]|nr:ferritin [Armatimonadota bacterium]
MLSKKMQDALNKQVNAELYSAYFYLSMSAYYESVNLPGFANWMRVQYQEETFHAMKIYDYINARGGRAILTAIEKPPTDWKSPIAPFEDTYKHEQKVTALINDLVNLAIEERDHATNSVLQWFVTEQVEEEKNASGILEQIKLLKDAPNGMFMIDRELGQRVFTPPAAAAE